MIISDVVDVFLGALFFIDYSSQVKLKTPEWEMDPVHFVPPPDWESKNIPRPIKQYMEYEWSLSTYTNDCGEENSLRIVPVYFWPGDQVDLPCLMCELAFVFNGKMKTWGKATNILKFLENPKRTSRFSSKYWSRITNGDKSPTSKLKNASEQEVIDWMPVVKDQNGIAINFPKKEPVYLQRNGKLSIIRASPASQGVYFCYDGQSRAHTSIFYVVMAITPPVRMSEMANVLADGCIDKIDHKLIRANFNWRYHFVPNVRHEAPKECLRDKKNEFCKADYYTQIDAEEGCTLDYCRKEFDDGIDMNLAVELRWEAWSKCEGNIRLQKREAHCYLVRKSGYEIPFDETKLPEHRKWMPQLNALFDQEPFTSKGIRLYSSLLASLFVDEEVMAKCHYEKKRLKTDRIWREILRTMGAKYKDGSFKGKIVQLDENGKLTSNPPTLRLTNPFQACMIYEYDKEREFEHVVGTYMTETRPCNSARSR